MSANIQLYLISKQLDSLFIDFIPELICDFMLKVKI